MSGKSYDNIKYHPQIEFIIDKLPANEVIEELVDEVDYISPKEAKDKTEETISHYDYLIFKCEKELRDLEFNNIEGKEYIKANRKKYYCQSSIRNEDEEIIEKFNDGAKDIEAETNAPMFYARLLSMKKDLEDKLPYLDKLAKIEEDNFKKELANYASQTLD